MSIAAPRFQPRLLSRGAVELGVYEWYKLTMKPWWALVTTAVLLVPATGTTSAGSGCRLDGATLTIWLADRGNVEVRRAGPDFHVTGAGFTDSTCGGATMTNVDLVTITGASSDEVAVVEFEDGAFVPGATEESGGVSEIEFLVDLGAESSDVFSLRMGNAKDFVRFGAAGINVHRDDDADIVFGTIPPNVGVLGRGGSDRLSAAGGLGTGTPFPSPIVLNGQRGNDQLTGGLGNDFFAGGPDDDIVFALSGPDGTDAFYPHTGKDTFSYAARTEDVTVTLDGEANDGASGENDNVGPQVTVVVGGAGNDFLVGGYLNRGNIFEGGDGNDLLMGLEGADKLFGGGGSDVLDGGNGDDVLRGEDGIGGNDTLDGGNQVRSMLGR